MKFYKMFAGIAVALLVIGSGLVISSSTLEPVVTYGDSYVDEFSSSIDFPPSPYIITDWNGYWSREWKGDGDYYLVNHGGFSLQLSQEREDYELINYTRQLTFKINHAMYRRQRDWAEIIYFKNSGIVFGILETKQELVGYECDIACTKKPIYKTLHRFAERILGASYKETVYRGVYSGKGSLIEGQDVPDPNTIIRRYFPSLFVIQCPEPMSLDAEVEYREIFLYQHKILDYSYKDYLIQLSRYIYSLALVFGILSLLFSVKERKSIENK